MFKIAITSGLYESSYGFKEGMARCKAHGYDCVDYGSFISTPEELFSLDAKAFSAKIEEDRRIIEGNGLTVCQTHGPWRCPPQDVTPEQREERFEKMSKSLFGTALLGSQYMVIHPIMPFLTPKSPDPQLEIDMNIFFFRRLAKKAEEYGVTICYENMPMRSFPTSGWRAIQKIVNEVNSPNFKICLDTGHTSILDDSPSEAIRGYEKGDLKVLHIHDNDGKGDWHRPPFTGVIDWNAFCSAIKETGFSGVLSCEANPIYSDDHSQDESLQIELANSMKKLAEMCL